MNGTGKISFRTIQHVLIVDDEIEFVKTLKRHLKRQDFTLETASDGRKALGLMAEMERPPDLVVSDVVMPHMDGMQLLEEIHRYYPTTSVLLLTGFGENAMAGGAIRKELDHFHQKPITPQEMLALIQHIDRKRGKFLTVERSPLKKGWSGL
jgi:DNA-binding NtrC family response regulator